MKVCSTNTLSDDIPVVSTRNQFYFLTFHNFFQLGPDFTYFSHGFGMDKVFGAPGIREFVIFPLIVNV